MARVLATRRFFLVAVAVIAAAVANPIVESLANSGVFGGHYADNNHLSVIPALLVGGLLVLMTLALRCMNGWHASSASGDWLVDVAKTFSRHSPSRDLPYVLPLQLIALFSMESAEQLAIGGKLLGGAAWLGGPILFSLIAHAAMGAFCLFALAAFMRALLRTLAAFVRAVVRFVWLALARAVVCFDAVRRATFLFGKLVVHVNHIGGRAPPLLHTPV